MSGTSGYICPKTVPYNNQLQVHDSHMKGKWARCREETLNPFCLLAAWRHLFSILQTCMKWLIALNICSSSTREDSAGFFRTVWYRRARRASSVNTPTASTMNRAFHTVSRLGRGQSESKSFLHPTSRKPQIKVTVWKTTHLNWLTDASAASLPPLVGRLF